jgi:hypothetical protein
MTGGTPLLLAANYFNQEGSLSPRSSYKAKRAAALAKWATSSLHEGRLG